MTRDRFQKLEDHYFKIEFGYLKEISIQINQFLDGSYDSLQESDIDYLARLISEETKKSILYLKDEVVEEIRFNIVQISDRDQLLRYRNYLTEKIDFNIRFNQSLLDFEKSEIFQVNMFDSKFRANTKESLWAFRAFNSFLYDFEVCASVWFDLKRFFGI